jgi:hypothetical protein
MEFFRSFGSRTPHESKSSTDSPVQTFLEDPDGSSSNPNFSVRTFVEGLDENLDDSSHAEMGNPTSSESRKGFILSDSAKRKTFVPVDDLPIRFDSGGSGVTTYPMERQSFTVGVLPHSYQLVQDSESRLGKFPIHHDAFTGGGDRSVRRMSGVTNVTTRETKRPKERRKDKEYRRMTLNHSNLPQFAPPDLTRAGFGQSSVERLNGSGRRIDASPASSVPSPFLPKSSGGPSSPFVGGFQPAANSLFEIKLVHEGRTVVQQVSSLIQFC